MPATDWQAQRMSTTCRTAWGICPHDGTPLSHAPAGGRSCERCHRAWPAAEVEPCPFLADVVVDPGLGEHVRMCSGHAQAFLGIARNTSVVDAPSDFFEADVA